ncbi:MAG: sterol desaturase family protein [Thermoplasmatota archaeon]
MDAGTSWRPLFAHRRMWPKWLAAGLLVLAAALLASPPDLIWAFAGAAAFTVGEYLLHRFLLHGPLHGLHDRHHATPRRLDVLFLPASTVAALPLLFAVGWPLAGPGPTATALLGLMAALLLYELVHFIAHRPAPAGGGGRLANWWRVHHLRHHGQGGRYAVLLPSLDGWFRSTGRP